MSRSYWSLIVCGLTVGLVCMFGVSLGADAAKKKKKPPTEGPPSIVVPKKPVAPNTTKKPAGTPSPLKAKPGVVLPKGTPKLNPQLNPQLNPPKIGVPGVAPKVLGGNAPKAGNTVAKPKITIKPSVTRPPLSTKILTLPGNPQRPQGTLNLPPQNDPNKVLQLKPQGDSSKVLQLKPQGDSNKVLQLKPQGDSSKVLQLKPQPEPLGTTRTGGPGVLGLKMKPGVVLKNGIMQRGIVGPPDGDKFQKNADPGKVLQLVEDAPSDSGKVLQLVEDAPSDSGKVLQLKPEGSFRSGDVGVSTSVLKQKVELAPGAVGLHKDYGLKLSPSMQRAFQTEAAMRGLFKPWKTPETLTLKPVEATILPLGVDNPEAANSEATILPLGVDDPEATNTEATLLQFGDGDKQKTPAATDKPTEGSPKAYRDLRAEKGKNGDIRIIGTDDQGKSQIVDVIEGQPFNQYDTLEVRRNAKGQLQVVGRDEQGTARVAVDLNGPTDSLTADEIKPSDGSQRETPADEIKPSGSDAPSGESPANLPLDTDSPPGETATILPLGTDEPQGQTATLMQFKGRDRISRAIQALKASPELRAELGLENLNLDKVSGVHQQRLATLESLANWQNSEADQKLGLLQQFELQAHGDLSRRLGLDARLISAGGWERHRHYGVLAPTFATSAFSSWYAGGGAFPRHSWCPRWAPWVDWCWWDTCPAIYDPRPYHCIPVVYQPCLPWVHHSSPVWLPLPVVACGTWLDVTPIELTSGWDIQLLAVRFVDNGHSEQNQGPRYRVWAVNNSPQPIETPVSVLLLASNEQTPTVDLPQAGVEVPWMDRGEVQVFDIRLPLAANQLGTTAKGQRVPFNYLHVLIDSHQQIPETSEDNNGAVLARRDILPVDPAAFSTDLTATTPDSLLAIAGEGFGPEPGQVILLVGDQQVPAEIFGWYDLGVQFAVPNFELAEPVEVEVLIVRGDGAASNPLAVQLTPEFR